ncbi:PREDICTED: uncharacterized protein LOC109215810 [Nicotiana attenuata]|uniref:uncharacterized protein LOC109215810 n=1 Tax=Nicotiana attenuata TaxID=49451 RepID=UPI000904C47F|nr:PREDICTED: uncharacterized protein LOC109215810 [Nicotiana attenuata]
MEGCIALRQEVVNMLRQGHLKELLSDRGRNNFARGCEHQGTPKPPSPARTINMIISRGDDASINDVKLTTMHKLKQSITREQYNELQKSIIFDVSDADDLTFPHNDALVITLRILDTDVNISWWTTEAALERPSGEITMPVLAGGVTLETTFHIMDQASAYNAIVGRSWIHPMRAIPSILYQIIKFPTLSRIFSIRGEQRMSRECYRIALDSTTTQQKKIRKKRHSNQQGRGRHRERPETLSRIPKWSRQPTRP